MTCKVYDGVSLCDNVGYFMSKVGVDGLVTLRSVVDGFALKEGSEPGVSSHIFSIRHTDEPGKFYLGIKGNSGKFYTWNPGTWSRTVAQLNNSSVKLGLVNYYDGTVGFAVSSSQLVGIQRGGVGEMSVKAAHSLSNNNFTSRFNMHTKFGPVFQPS